MLRYLFSVQPADVVYSHYGIIFRSDDCYRHGKVVEIIALQGILIEVLGVALEVRIIGHYGLREGHAGLMMHDVAEIIFIGKEMLASFAGTSSICQESRAGRWRGSRLYLRLLYRDQGPGLRLSTCLRFGIADDECLTAIRRAKFATQGKAHEVKRFIIGKAGDVPYCLECFFDQGAMKEPLIQVMALTVVTEIQPEYIIASVV